MPHMTRIERVREHLRIFGPQTSKQISHVFGWPLSTASSVMSQAQAYGYIAVARIIPHSGPHLGGKGHNLWAVKDGKKICTESVAR